MFPDMYSIFDERRTYLSVRISHSGQIKREEIVCLHVFWPNFYMFMFIFCGCLADFMDMHIYGVLCCEGMHNSLLRSKVGVCFCVWMVQWVQFAHLRRVFVFIQEVVHLLRSRI